jgi:hypothetical protein
MGNGFGLTSRTRRIENPNRVIKRQGRKDRCGWFRNRFCPKVPGLFNIQGALGIKVGNEISPLPDRE